MSSTMRRTALLALLLGAFALRVFRIESQSVWWDEGISLHLATSTMAQLVADRLDNIHPPLYFLLLKGWVTLVGVTPFAARLLGALASTAQVALAYAVARRWFRSQSVAGLTAVFVALSPLSIIYGQEVRVYAFLPLIYLGLIGVMQQLLAERAVRPRLYVLLGVTMWLGIHLHYIALFMVAYVGLWGVLVLWRQRRWRALRWLVATGALVIVASLPWFVAVVRNLATIQNKTGGGTFLTDPVPLGFLLPQVWLFHLTGLAGALRYPTAVWGSVVVAALAVLLLLWAVGRQRWWRVGVWAAHWLVPLLAALYLWSVRSFSHPRYVSMFALGLLPLLAALVMMGNCRRQRPLQLLLAGAVLTVSGLGLWHYFFDPSVSKDNIRGAASYLEQVAAPDDLIMIPDTDWSLPFEYDGATAVVMAEVQDRPAVWDRLGAWTADLPTVHLLDYDNGTRDWQRLVAFALESAGSVTAVQDFDGIFVQSYRLDAPIAAPELTPLYAQFGDLQLNAAWVSPQQPATDAVTVALRWGAQQMLTERIQLRLQLVDADGWPLATQTAVLFDARERPTDYWQAGETAVTYHELPLPLGIAPLDYTVTATLFTLAADGAVRTLEWTNELGAPQGQQVALGTTRLLSGGLVVGERPYVLSPQTPQPLAGLSLLAATVGQQEVAPGQSVFVGLLWRLDAATTDVPQLALRQGDGVLTAVSAVPEQYLPAQWAVGEVVYSHQRLVVPPEAAGSASLVLILDGAELSLGAVQISATARQMTPPPIANPLDVALGDVARLVGFDLPQTTVSATASIPLTLVWRAETTGTAVAYTVFAQLLDGNGRLIAQHDAPPASGQRPTTGWVAGEYVVDDHVLTFRESDYVGAAVLVVGLYDPATGTRLVDENGRDFVMLPIEIVVTR